MLERVSGTVRSEPASRASGKVVIVTGGSSGMRLAVAERLAAEGAKS